LHAAGADPEPAARVRRCLRLRWSVAEAVSRRLSHRRGNGAARARASGPLQPDVSKILKDARMNLSPPAAGEFAPYFAGYIARVAHVGSPIDDLAAQRDRMLALLGTGTDDRAGYRYAPGKWTIADLVGHITDAERIFAYRMLRIGRGDQTPLPGWDENEY